MNASYPNCAAVWQCPVCDLDSAKAPTPMGALAVCSACGYVLWCNKKTVDGVVVLEVVPVERPEDVDTRSLAKALLQAPGPPRVAVDLSSVCPLRSWLMAKLITLNRRVVGAGGRLVVFGLHAFVRQTFASTRLDRVIPIADDEQAALSDL